MSELVGLNAQTPSFTQTLSGLMGLKQQQQQLQGGAADVQMKQQDARQRAALAKVNYNKWMGEDGTLDTNKMLADPQLAELGDAAPIAINQGIAMKSHQIENKKALLGLNNDTLSSLGQITQAVSQNPEVKKGTKAGLDFAKDSLTKWATAQGIDVAKSVAPYMMPIMNGQVPPEALSDGLKHISNMTLDVAKQKELTRPNISTMQGPNGLQMVNTNSLAPEGLGPIGVPMAQGVAPGTTNQTGQFVTGGPQTGVTPVAGNANPTAAQATAQLGAARGITDRVQQAMTAANNTQQAQDALSRAQAILESPESLSTGASFDTTRKLKNFLSSAGIDTTGAEDANSLTKNLARYEGARATAAGLGGTDAARELAHNGSPNTSIDNKALVGVVKQSLATEKAIAAYANKQTGVTDPDQLARNENTFRNIPHLIEGYEYGMSRTPQEANEFLQKHGLSKADMAKTRIAIKQFESP